MSKDQPKQMRFRAKVESGLVPLDPGKDLYWTAIRIPFDPVKVWPDRNGMRVRGTINGIAFRSWLFGGKVNGHLLLVTRTMQKQAKAAPNSIAEIVIEPNLEDRSASPPPELAKLFREDREVKKWFKQLNYSTRNYICDAIAQPKSAEARQRRAEQWVERMMLVMEGEIEIPPVLQVAFRRQPRARTGWDALTRIQRRNNLLAIFLCQSPEARAKRVDKAVEDCLRAVNRSDGMKESTAEEDYG